MKTSKKITAKAALLILFLAAASLFSASDGGAQTDPRWDPWIGCPDHGWDEYDGVYAIGVYNDGYGDGDEVYVGGDFTITDECGTGDPVTNIAKWNGQHWEWIGSALDDYTVHALEVHDGKLYIGTDDGLYYYDGGWITKVPGISGADGSVHALHATDDGWGELFVGGCFTHVNGLVADSIAIYDGSWITIDSLINPSGKGVISYDEPNSMLEPATVYAIEEYNDKIFIGGHLFYPGHYTEEIGLIAQMDRYDPVIDKVLGGLQGDWWYHRHGVFALEVYDGRLFAGGKILTAYNSNGTVALDIKYLVEYDDYSTAWIDSTGGVDLSWHWPLDEAEPVWALAVFDDGTGAGEEIYVGGEFDRAGFGPDIYTYHIAKWDESTGWTKGIDGLEDNPSDYYDSIFALEAVWDDYYWEYEDLIVGGEGFYGVQVSADPGNYEYVESSGVLRYAPDEYFAADTYIIDSINGSQVKLQLDAGANENYYRNCLVLGSATGTYPGFPLPGGYVEMPLVWDSLTDTVLALLNISVFLDFLGQLDGSGRAVATIDAPPIPGWAGTDLYFSFIMDNPYDYASEPLKIRIQ